MQVVVGVHINRSPTLYAKRHFLGGRFALCTARLRPFSVEILLRSSFPRQISPRMTVEHWCKIVSVETRYCSDFQAPTEHLLLASNPKIIKQNALLKP